MKYTFLFPGQGSQCVGMGKDISKLWSVARQVFAEANDVLDYDLKKLCFEGPLSQLTSTEKTQPAILTTNVAILQILEEKDLKADIAVGHSVGMFASLVAARCLTFADALRLVQERGRLMNLVRQRGTMLAVIAATEELLAEVLRNTEYLDVAAYNSPTQMVFSGSEEAIQNLEKSLDSRTGIRAKRFLVSHAFHSRLMAEKKDEWQQCLQASVIEPAKIPVGLNVTGELCTEPTRIREDLLMQFTHPVHWRQLFSTLVATESSCFIEVGAGRTLAGLARSWQEKPQVHTTDTVAAIVRLLKHAG